MPLSEEELKAQLMAEAEAAISELAEQAADKDEITLSDIEQLVRKTGQQMMEQLTARLVEVSAGKGEPTMCSECGQPMRYKGRKARDVVTETGEVWFERGYYYCQACRKGIFPPG